MIIYVYDVCPTCSFAKYFTPYTRAQKMDTCINVESYIRGYHEYVDIWEPKIEQNQKTKKVQTLYVSKFLKRPSNSCNYHSKRKTNKSWGWLRG